LKLAAGFKHTKAIALDVSDADALDKANSEVRIMPDCGRRIAEELTISFRTTLSSL
jgi:hypothetical protein